MSAAPELSIVLVAPVRFASVRRTVRYLRAQTVCDRIELVLVAPTEEALADRRPGETDGFAALRVVVAGEIVDLDEAAALGLAGAQAGAVAMLEDHVYPEPDWAEAILEASRGPWTAIGSVFTNANPDTSLSWANFLLSYGGWSEPTAVGEVETVSRHNVTLDRAALEPHVERFGALLGRGGGLLAALAADGGRFYLAGDAQLSHTNPSRLTSSATLRFHAGRLYAAQRTASERWPAARRALYVAGAFLIPVIRFRRVRQALLGAGRHRGLPRGVDAALALCLAFDATGQAAGYAFGAGSAEERLVAFEHDRLRHVTADERAQLAE